MKESKIKTKDLSLFYGEKMALNSISMDIPEKEVTAFIGLQVVVNLLFSVP